MIISFPLNLSFSGLLFFKRGFSLKQTDSFVHQTVAMMREESADGLHFHGLRNWENSGSQGFGACGSGVDWAEMNNSRDPVDFLPSDPFGMNRRTTLPEINLDHKISEAIAGWIGFCIDDYQVYADDLVAGFSCYCNKTLWPSFELPMDSGSSSFFCFDEDFVGLALDEDGDRRSWAMEEASISGRGDSIHNDGDLNSLHDGLLLSLGYLDVLDLLSVERVCRSLRSSVQNDTLLWRCIHVGSPSGENMDDDDLYRLTQRARGNLQCLSLVHCSSISDEGLKRVLENNPSLKKLSVPGCLRLTADGLINSLKALQSSGAPRIKSLKLGTHFVGSAEEFEELRLLVGADDGPNQMKARKQRFYHDFISSPGCDDEADENSVIDIEICPRCQKCRLLFDCPFESCCGRGPEHCRACSSCIERCTECGRCVDNCRYTETFLFHNICAACLSESSGSEDMQTEK
ncbi:F-box protein SKIP14 [Platanthera zijinensis]|uniref:F-box protein SKIP14 n=1 Tax=Platanthera zijinensis TaxID=2320716 RepID=A0AAP0B209_9ASPA